MTIRITYGVNSPTVKAGFIAGLECEIENIKYWDTDKNTLNQERWNVTEDGSLRNSGREFITNIPSNREELIEDFKHLQSCLIFRNKTDNPFSERTSTHVHVNCLDLEPEQVKSILHYYALFEPVFFRLVAPERANNIHCVGLNNTVLPESYRKPLDAILGSWSKYTALNLLPLREIGTIEFRHLQGTDDATLLNEWLTVLENLWTIGKTQIMNKKQLVDPTFVPTVYQQIFKDTRAAQWLPYTTTMLQDSLVDLKLTFH